MSTWLSLGVWGEFAVVLALELVVLFAVAKIISLRIRSAQRLRSLWQITLVAIFMVFAGEINGARGWFRVPQAQNASEAPRRALVVTIKDNIDPALASRGITSEALAQESLRGLDSTGVFTPGELVPYIAVTWLLVTASLLLRIAGAQLFTFVFRSRARHWKDPHLPKSVQEICQLLRIRRRITLASSFRIAAPFTFGTWRPVIVLPHRFHQIFTPEQQRAALAHELAHVAAFDSAWRTFGNVMCALLWWHPCIWLAKRELERASELAADEASLLMADGPTQLAECLLRCAKSPSSPAFAAWLGMDGGGFRSGLGKRVERLLGLQPHVISKPLPWFLRVVGPLLCVTALFFGISLMMPSFAGIGWHGSLLGSAFAAVREQPSLIDSQTSAPSTPAASLAEADLFTRTYHVDLNQLPDIALPPADALKGARLYDSPGNPITDPAGVPVPRRQRRPTLGDKAPLRGWFKSFFAAAGADFDAPGRSVFWNDRMQLLAVRGSQQDLAAVEKALQGAVTETPRDAVTTPVPAVAANLNDNQAAPLHTRFFKIDPVTFERGLRSLAAIDFKGRPVKSTHDGSGTNEFITRFKSFMESAGVDLSAADKAVFMSTTKGMLMVRATLRDLETVQQTVAALNTNPPQLTIRVKALEVTRDSARSNELDWFLGTYVSRNDSGTNASAANVIETGDLNLVKSGTRNSVGGSLPSPTITGVLTDEQFRAVIKGLEQRGGTDLLSAPDVTTLSGRQAQIKVVDIRYVVTGLDYSTNGAPTSTSNGQGAVTLDGEKSGGPRPIAEPFEIGPTIDLIPHVLLDGVTIQMTVVPTLREFLGYDDPAGPWTNGGTNAPPVPAVPTPLPRFRMRQAATTAMVYDGQTLVVGAGSARHAQKENHADGTITTNFVEKSLFFFITPRLIDPAGNAIHSAEQLKNMHRSVPRQ
jgi:beta-lactamase regulating signal transducer with metallopeptidase domain